MREQPRISSTDLFDELDERLARFEVELLPDQQFVDFRRQKATANVNTMRPTNRSFASVTLVTALADHA